jgi:hypothetical protein
MNVMPVFKMIENRFRAVFSGAGTPAPRHAAQAGLASIDKAPSSAMPVKQAKAKAAAKKAPAKKASKAVKAKAGKKRAR